MPVSATCLDFWPLDGSGLARASPVLTVVNDLGEAQQARGSARGSVRGVANMKQEPC